MPASASMQGIVFKRKKCFQSPRVANCCCRNSYPVWPGWAIYWTLGNFLKPLATINWSHCSYPKPLSANEVGCLIRVVAKQVNNKHLALNLWQRRRDRERKREHGALKLNEMKARIVSVTRFGEISITFTSLWQISDVLFLIWQNAEPTFTILC